LRRRIIDKGYWSPLPTLAVEILKKVAMDLNGYGSEKMNVKSYRNSGR
jgi:hypothetical protein